MEGTKPRFAAFNVESCEKMKYKQLAKNTENSTTYAARLITNFCKESNILGDKKLNDLTPDELLPVLTKFYMCARNEKGEVYKVNTMRSLRSSLQRYLLSLLKIDIINDKLFSEANVVFENVLKEIRSLGKGVTDHHPEVTTDDLRKLHECFDTNDPRGLQELVWLNIMFLLIRVSRQNIRGMTKSTFAIGSDCQGKRFVYQKEGVEDYKTNGANDTSRDERIYETGGTKCPVMCFQKYVSKLSPLLEALWQRPRTTVDPVAEPTWYCNVPHGEKFLGNMMSMLSKKYKLSQKYTNHCLKVTNIGALEDVVIHKEEERVVHVISATPIYGGGTTHLEIIQPQVHTSSESRKRKIPMTLDDQSPLPVQPVMESSEDASCKLQDDLNNAETSLVYAYKRIEKLKASIDSHKQNEESFNVCLRDYQTKLELSEERYGILKEYVSEKLDAANCEIERIRQQTEIDVAKMQDALKMAEGRISSLEDQITHNVYESKHTALIYDECRTEDAGE